MITKPIICEDLCNKCCPNSLTLVTAHHNPMEWSTVIISPVLKMRKLMHREVKQLTQSHTVLDLDLGSQALSHCIC